MEPKNGILYFFDLDETLIKDDKKYWFIDKNEPHKPLLRIDSLEMNKILSGLYVNDNIKITYNDKIYYISNEILSKINKKKNINIEDIGISLIEFFDDRYINNSKFKFLHKNINHLINKNSKLCLLTGRAYQNRHTKLLYEIRKKLQKNNIELYKIYFVGDNMSNIYMDDIALKKVYILLEHLIGFKIKDDAFTAVEQEDWYKHISFYDDNKLFIEYANNIQKIFSNLLRNTDDILFEKIKERVEIYNLAISVNLVTTNEVNLFKTNVIKITMPIKYPIINK